MLCNNLLLPSFCCTLCFSGKAGRKVLFLEKKQFPRDKHCGDAVVKTAIEILDEMGLYETLLATNKAKVVSCKTVTNVKYSSVNYDRSITCICLHFFTLVVTDGSV